MNCPGPELAAAYADGRLDADEAARFLEHCADCDDCRRTLAVLSTPRESARVPADVESRAIAAVRRALDRDRDRTPRLPLRRVAAPRPRQSPVGILIAAGLLLGFVVLVLTAKQPPAKVIEPRGESAQQQRDVVVPPQVVIEVPAPAPALRVEAPPAPAPAPKAQVAEAPTAPPAPRIDGPKVEYFAEPVAKPLPRPEPEETRVEDPPRTPSHTVAARTLGELQITDITGALTISRKGAKSKERLAGVARLSEGDVLTAEKPASFQVEGRHPVVLAENTSVSLAYVPAEQAPWMRIHSGEVLVDSVGSARWVVTDGTVAVAVKPARARFTASRGDQRLSFASLSEPLYVQPDGGQVHAIHLGEELHVGKALAELRPFEPALAARKNAAFDAARPRQRTIFLTTCDPADAKREHFFVMEGAWYRNEALLSRERADRTAAASVGPNPRFAWRETYVLRFRAMTNCKSFELQMRVDERKYTMFKPIAVDRKKADQWVSVEMPFTVSGWQFRRDDGQNSLVVNADDKVDAIRLVVRPQDAQGDQKPYVLVDDVQIVEKE